MTIYRSDGREEVHWIPREDWVSCIDSILGAQYLDHVDLRDGRFMWCDDLGHQKNLPINRRASELYWQVCVPGTVVPIVGDVAITNVNDFED